MEKLEFYDRRGSLLKTMDYNNYKQYKGKHWRAAELYVVNHQSNKETKLLFNDFDFDVSLSEDDFSQNSLKSRQVITWVALLILVFSADISLAQEEARKYNFSADLDLGIDLTAFFQSAAYDQQEQLYPGIFTRPKFTLDWNGGSSNIIFEGFGRWDINGNSRSHWDVR